MSDRPKVKVLISYHKPAPLLKGDFFVPIHLGRAVAKEASKDGTVSQKDYQWMLDNMIGDDTGENISLKNRFYCESSALYWAWKNYEQLGNPEYIGFMTYRRHFIFNEKLYENIQKYLTDEEKAYRDIMIYNEIPNYQDVFGINSSNILDACSKYDCILPQESEFKYISINTLKDDYIMRIEGTHLKDYNLMIDTISELFPKYAESAKNRALGSNKFLYHSFICKKEIFFDYCNVLFTTLNALEPKIDTTNYSINGKRALAYLGELIFDTYFSQLKKDKKYKLKEYGITMLIDNKPIEKTFNLITYIKTFLLKNIYPSKKKRQHYKQKFKNIEKMNILLKG